MEGSSALVKVGVLVAILACLGTARASFRSDMLHAHNSERAKVYAEPLKWDEQLAAYAEDYAAEKYSCHSHSGEYGYLSGGKSEYGGQDGKYGYVSGKEYDDREKYSYASGGKDEYGEGHDGKYVSGKEYDDGEKYKYGSGGKYEYGEGHDGKYGYVSGKEYDDHEKYSYGSGVSNGKYVDGQRENDGGYGSNGKDEYSGSTEKYGFNFYEVSGGSTPTATDAVNAWVGERKDYYTQMVSRNAKRVGCGYLDYCEEGHVVVFCSYDPPEKHD